MKIQFKCEDHECPGFLGFRGGNRYGCTYRCEICKRIEVYPTRSQIRMNPERYPDMIKNNHHIFLGKYRKDLLPLWYADYGWYDTLNDSIQDTIMFEEE